MIHTLRLDPDRLRVESFPLSAAPAPDEFDAALGPVRSRVTSCPERPPLCTCRE